MYSKLLPFMALLPVELGSAGFLVFIFHLFHYRNTIEWDFCRPDVLSVT